jgi:hypothetical protein
MWEWSASKPNQFALGKKCPQKVAAESETESTPKPFHKAGKEKNLLPLPGIKPQFLRQPAHNLVTAQTDYTE